MGKEINLPSSEIDSDNPWGDDKLNRSHVAQTLTKLITGKEQPLVVSLSGGWGTGKTFMLQRWQKDLEKGGYVSIYFNAWEDDFCNDPFVAIIGQITQGIASYKELKGVLGQVKKAAKKFIACSSLKMVDKATYGLVGKESIDSMKNKVLSEYEKQREAKKELKDSLREMSTKVRKMSTTDKANSGKPLVFIVDELDRCRPTFAIELLERIKHVFDVPNMVFVVGINRDELCQSIRSVYGEIDANTYLQRFFHADLTMPEVSARDYVEYVLQHYFPVHSGVFNSRIAKFTNFLYTIAQNGNLPLRDLEHYIRHIYLIGSKVDTLRNDASLLFLLIMVKMKRPELYKKWAVKQVQKADILNAIVEILGKDTYSRISSILPSIELVDIDAEYFNLVEILG